MVIIWPNGYNKTYEINSVNEHEPPFQYFYPFILLIYFYINTNLSIIFPSILRVLLRVIFLEHNTWEQVSIYN